MKRRIRNRTEMNEHIQKFKALPTELKTELLSWDYISRSPYSHSYYSDKGKNWKFTPQGCLRISNHWNFKSKKVAGKNIVHCKTDIAVRNHNYWTLAIYEGRVWRVLKSLPMNK